MSRVGTERIFMSSMDVRNLDMSVATVNGVSTAGASDFHTRVRQQIHNDALDAAEHMIIAEGWAAVTMKAVAAAVGVSRQTLYKAFSSRHDIGQALILRQAEQFLEGVAHHVAAHHDLTDALHAAITYTFTEATTNPLIRAILTNTHDDTDTLLPVLTTDAQPLITLASQVLHQHITTRAPHLDPEDITATADTLIRLTLSHLTQPLDPTPTTITRLTRLAQRNLRIPDPD